MGSIDVALDDTAAPGTVANFLSYMDAGVYDGGCFYRTVTPDNQPNDTVRIAVIQGGKSGDYAFDETANLPLERTTQTGLNASGWNDLDGSLHPDSANSEFFICVGDQPELDFGGKRNPDGQGFAAFGIGHKRHGRRPRDQSVTVCRANPRSADSDHASFPD